MDRRTVVSAVLASGCMGAAFAAPRGPRHEQTLGGPCEGCDWVFDDLPAALSSRARIAPLEEPGVPMVIEGVVTSARGTPVTGVIVYAYHTNQAGLYPRAGNRHGRLRGWALADARGHYRFDTIRPGAYPERNVPEHVHMHVIERGIGTYYIDNLEFEDDPLNSRRRGEERGGNGLMRPVRREGAWHARRDIVLGLNISDYPRR